MEVLQFVNVEWDVENLIKFLVEILLFDVLHQAGLYVILTARVLYL